MASGVQSVDDLIMCLVSMGFEVSDGQQAIQAGKLTVEEAVEWILLGKPGSAAPSSQPALRLAASHGMTASNPFTNPIPLPDLHGSEQSDSAAPPMGQEEEKLISRAHLNEEQRRIRDKFEEKQREEAKKRIKEDRMMKKKAHEQALKQIAEDRAKMKHMKMSPDKSNKLGGSTQDKATKETDSPNTSGSEQKKCIKCVIQVRLPGGQLLRHNFKPESLLREVWDFVQGHHTNMAGMTFMQPFPRQEYSREDMFKTLEDLKLVPTGSLVLKKGESSPPPRVSPCAEETKPSSMETGENESDTVADSNSQHNQVPGDVDVQHNPPLQHISAAPHLDQLAGHPLLGHGGPAGHQWGSGHVLEEPEQNEADNMEVNPEHIVPMDEGEDIPPDQGAAGGPPWGGMGGGFPGFHMQGYGHAWGQGHRLAGEHAAPHLPEKRVQELAAQAASQRLGNPALQPQPQCSAVKTHAVQALIHLCIKIVANKLCDPRLVCQSLSGLPADIATKLLAFLVKERLLKPKTLQPFIPCHLRQLVLDFYPYATNELLLAVRFHVNLTHLSLVSCSLITDKGLQPLTVLKRLKVLNLASCRQLTNKCLDVVASFPHLVTLNLEEAGVTDQGIQEYTQSRPQELQHLNLNRTAVTHNIFSSLKVLPKLRSLSLEQSRVSSLTGIQALTELQSLNIAATSIVTESLLCLQGCPNLVALNIANTDNVAGDQALEYIQSLQLHTLQLPSRHTTTDAGIQYLAAMPLTSLDLTNYIHVGNAGMEAIGQIHSLKKLLLSNTKLTDEGMVLLEGLTDLEILYIDKTMITDAGAELLRNLTKLQELSMAETGVTSNFLVQGCLNNCLLITKLNLCRTGVSDRGILSLTLPHLTLLNLDGTRVRMNTALSLARFPQLQKVSAENLAAPESDEES